MNEIPVRIVKTFLQVRHLKQGFSLLLLRTLSYANINGFPEGPVLRGLNLKAVASIAELQQFKNKDEKALKPINS